MAYAITIPVFVLNYLVIIVHVCASGLLIKLKHSRLTGNQHDLLVALRLTELYYAIVDNISKASEFFGYHDISTLKCLFSVTAIILINMSIMILIILDRFLVFYLHLKYRTYCSRTKYRMVLIILGTFSILSYIPALRFGLRARTSFARRLACYIYQKQSPRGVLRKRCSENMQQIYRRTFRNFNEIALRHWCSPVNLLHIFRTAFSKNTSVWLLLIYPVFETFFDFIALFTYSCIFWKHWDSILSRKKMSEAASNPHQRSHFKLLVLSLIILTYFCCMIIHFIKLRKSLGLIESHEILRSAYILIPIVFLADPVIYIFNIGASIRYIKRYRSRKKTNSFENTTILHRTSSRFQGVQCYHLLINVYVTQ